ncbi:MAG: hypothetical protein ACYC2E_05830 [Sulfuricella sp.]
MPTLSRQSFAGMVFSHSLPGKVRFQGLSLSTSTFGVAPIFSASLPQGLAEGAKLIFASILGKVERIAEIHALLELLKRVAKRLELLGLEVGEPEQQGRR